MRAEGEEGFARRALVLWSSQHDTGRTDTRTDEHGRVHVSLREFALPSREHCQITAGYVAAIFEFSGCKNVRVQKQSCCVDRDPECSWVVDWDRNS